MPCGHVILVVEFITNQYDLECYWVIWANFTPVGADEKTMVEGRRKFVVATRKRCHYPGNTQGQIGALGGSL